MIIFLFIVALFALGALATHYLPSKQRDMLDGKDHSVLNDNEAAELMLKKIEMETKVKQNIRSASRNNRGSF